MIKIVRESLREEVTAEEVSRDKDAIESLLYNKRSVAYVDLDDKEIEKLNQKGINVIKVFPEDSLIRKEYYNEMIKGGWNYSSWRINELLKIIDKSYIIYTLEGKEDAEELYDYMKKHKGFLEDNTPEDAYKIGKLLGYTDESILEYIKRVYHVNELPSKNN